MNYINWNSEKNKKLIKERGVSFEICLVKIESGNILDVLNNIVPCGRDRRVMNELADSSTRVADTTRYSTYSSSSLGRHKNSEVFAAILARRNKNYPNQKIFVLEIERYVYLVPFVENEDEIFLKTIIPSRKFTKKYLK